ncbi:hypothetical protein L7F22_025015 [Adiantum nelumboides]|nr:hypothetical protein [Adiantum nelumboides]
MSGRGRGSKTTAASTRSSLKIEGTSVPLSSVPTGGCLVQLAEEDSRALGEMKNIAEGRLQDYKSRLEGAKKQVDDQVRELHRVEGAQSSNTLAIKLQQEIDCMQDPVAGQRLIDLIGQFSKQSSHACSNKTMHSTRKSGLITPGMRPAPGMEPALEAKFAVGNEVCGVVEDILMAKSSAVKSPRQQLTPRRLLRSPSSAKASPSVDTRDEASDEVVADAMKATPFLAGKKPTPKHKKLTSKNLDNKEAEKRGTYTRRTRSSGFLDEGSVGSLALSYLKRNPRGGATASRGVTSKKRVSFDTVEGYAGSLAQSYPVNNPRGGATASRGVTGKKKEYFDTVDHCTSTAEFVPNVPNAIDVQVVHDDVHTDVDLGKLEKDAIVDATVVDACTNDIVDAMEVDASTDSTAADGNVNDGGTESIVHAVIDGVLDAVVAMGTDATLEFGTYAILDASMYSTVEGNVNDGGTESIIHNVIDAILDAIVAMDAMADATIVDACKNDTVDAMEVDASTDAAVEVVCPSDAADDIVDADC